MERQGAVLFQFNFRAVDAAGAGRFLHLGKDRHVAGGVSSAGFDADDDADAHEPALLAGFFLLFAKLVVVDFFQQGFQQSGVIAAVVDVAADGAVWHFIGLDQIFPAHFDGAQIERLGHPIHHPFPDETHARLADAAVWDDRALVGHHRVAFHVDGRGFVGVRQIIELVGEVNRQRADGAADVVIFFELETEHGAVVLHRRFGFDFLVASVTAGHHVLGAVLDPFYRPAGFHRQQRHQHDVLADQVNLLAESRRRHRE